MLNCITAGESAYKEYVQCRLVDKDVMSHSTISSNRIKKCPKKVDLEKEKVDTIRYINYARVRNFDVIELLKYELTSTSFFLTANGYLKKPDKAKFAVELQSKLTVKPTNEMPSTYMTIIDFMAFVRKVPIKKLNLTTFGEFATTLWQIILATGSKSSRIIDITFDIYQPKSIKELERERRSTVQNIEISII